MISVGRKIIFFFFFFFAWLNSNFKCIRLLLINNNIVTLEATSLFVSKTIKGYILLYLNVLTSTKNCYWWVKIIYECQTFIMGQKLTFWIKSDFLNKKLTLRNTNYHICVKLVILESIFWVLSEKLLKINNFGKILITF